MKYYSRLLAIVIFSIVGISLLQLPVSAAEESSLTEVQIGKIRSQCSEIQTSLSQVHVNDALLRVNRGQLYELISTKLMAQLNSRIALNRLDSTKLVAAATTYERHLKEFRTNYQLYEEALSANIKIDCSKQPISFYDQLILVRAKRSDVVKSTKDLAHSINAYGLAFDEFKKPYFDGEKS